MNYFTEKRKTIITVLSLMLIAGMSFAQQGQLTGSLINTEKQAVPYANVVLYTLPDSTLITGTVSTTMGEFAVNAPFNQSFFIKISAVGFQSFYSKAYTFK